MNSEIKNYKAPAGIKLSDDYTVKVNGELIDVLRGLVWQPSYVESYGGNYSFASFDFSGEYVEVEITSNKLPLNNLKILPDSRNIEFVVEENTVVFKLFDSLCQLSIEPDKKQSPLLLFVNPIESIIPDKDDPSVKFFEPGVYDIGILELNDNETLYISGGAVLHGSINVKGNNVKIMGRGMMDGVVYFPGGGPMTQVLLIEDCNNVKVEGIIIKDGWGGFAIWIAGSDNVIFDNVKVIASRTEHNDGINDVNSSNVIVRNCFVRSDDDCICTKGFGYKNNKAVDGFFVENCVLWTDKAHIWRLGAECRAEAMRNLHFKNIDVLHYVKDFWNGDDMPTCISIQPAEEMLMENVVFEDIRINNSGEEWAVEIKPKSTRWALNLSPGKLRNVLLKNIYVTNNSGDENVGKIRIHGDDPEHFVDNIVIENYFINGVLVKSDDPAISVTGYVKSLKII